MLEIVLQLTLISKESDVTSSSTKKRHTHEASAIPQTKYLRCLSTRLDKLFYVCYARYANYNILRNAESESRSGPKKQRIKLKWPKHPTPARAYTPCMFISVSYTCNTIQILQLQQRSSNIFGKVHRVFHAAVPAAVLCEFTLKCSRAKQFAIVEQSPARVTF